jgi:hypothetical protein
MTDPCKYERLYKDDPITNGDLDYDDELELETWVEAEQWEEMKDK